MAKPASVEIITNLKLKATETHVTGISGLGRVNERTVSLKSLDKPHDDLITKAEELVGAVREILELPVGLWQDRIAITGVSWSCHEESNVRGAVITALVTLETTQSPLVVNTPHLPYEAYDSNAHPEAIPPLMPEEWQDVLNELEAEAKAFLDGKRQQMDMFDAA